MTFNLEPVSAWIMDKCSPFFYLFKRKQRYYGGGGTVGGTGGQGAEQGAVKDRTEWPGSTGPMYFIFRHLYPFSPSHQGSVWVLPAISLLLKNTVSPVRACPIIWLERFRGTQKDDDRGPFSIQSSLAFIQGWRWRCFKVEYRQNWYIFRAYPSKKIFYIEKTIFRIYFLGSWYNSSIMKYSSD